MASGVHVTLSAYYDLAGPDPVTGWIQELSSGSRLAQGFKVRALLFILVVLFILGIQLGYQPFFVETHLS